MGQLQKAEAKILELGYQILAISVDRPEKLRESIDKHSLTYTLLSDSKATSLKAFGLAFKLDDKTVGMYQQYNIDLDGASGESHHILPTPAAFIVSTDGVIKFKYVNPDHRVRAHPDVMLAAAKAALE